MILARFLASKASHRYFGVNSICMGHEKEANCNMEEDLKDFASTSQSLR